MSARVHASMDKLCGIQQGLEASMMQHRRELLNQFDEKLEHACKHAGDLAFDRARDYIEPGMEVLGEQINTCRATASSNTEKLHQQLVELTARLDSACDAITALHSRTESSLSRLDELRVQLTSEVNSRSACCQTLTDDVNDLRSAAAEEKQRRASAEKSLVKAIQDASAAAALAARDSGEHVNKEFRHMEEKVAALEVQYTHILQQRVAQHAQEVRENMAEMTGQIHTQIHDAKEHGEKQVALSNTRLETIINASIEELRREWTAGFKDVQVKIDRSAEQQAELLQAQFQDGLDRAAQKIDQTRAEGHSALDAAVASVKEQVAGVEAGLTSRAQDLQDAIAKGDTSRIHLRRALQAESAQAKTASAELLKASAHGLDSLESRRQKDVTELRKAIADLEVRVSWEADRRCTEHPRCPAQGEGSQDGSRSGNEGCSRATTAPGGRLPPVTPLQLKQPRIGSPCAA